MENLEIYLSFLKIYNNNSLEGEKFCLNFVVLS